MKRTLVVLLLVAVAILLATFNWRPQAFGGASRNQTTSPTALQDRATEAILPNNGIGVVASPQLPAPSPAARPGRPLASGPALLSLSNERRLDVFSKDLALQSPAHSDLRDLGLNETQDPEWSDQVERLIQESVQRHGTGMTGLQASLPHCTQTVCELMATGGFSSEATNADWQRLMGFVMNEPWFREHFIDTRTSVGGDAQGVMYISYFIRKP